MPTDLLNQIAATQQRGVQPQQAAIKGDAVATLIHQLASTRNAPGDIVHFNNAGDVRGVTPRVPAAVGYLDIRSDIPPAADPQHLLGALPSGTDAGKVSRLDTSIAAASAVLSSGAHLVVCDTAEENKPLSLGNGEIGWERRERRFDLIDRAPFTMIAGDGDELVPHPPRITSRVIDTSGMKVIGARVELSRAAQRQFASEGVMAAEVLASFALGIGAALDKLYLDALLASLPPAFSLAALAATGFDVPAARALIGTNATGASITAHGNLVALALMSVTDGGIPARMTAAMAETLVLVPARSAIAIDAEIRIITQQTGKQGGLALTALASAIPVVDAGSAWQVAA